MAEEEDRARVETSAQTVECVERLNGGGKWNALFRVKFPDTQPLRAERNDGRHFSYVRHAQPGR
jgi:hypothetical protein